MGPSAHVTETEALIDFRAQLCAFADQAKDALGVIAHEIQRTHAFLDERQHEWHAEVRRSEELVIQAKIELSRVRNQRIGDRSPDTVFQEKALRQAQARLEFAEEKLAATKRWQRDLPHELRNYEAPARQLQNALDAELPRMLAFLEKKITALEAYLRSPPA